MPVQSKPALSTRLAAALLAAGAALGANAADKTTLLVYTALEPDQLKAY